MEGRTLTLQSIPVTPSCQTSDREDCQRRTAQIPVVRKVCDCSSCRTWAHVQSAHRCRWLCVRNTPSSVSRGPYPVPSCHVCAGFGGCIHRCSSLVLAVSGAFKKVFGMFLGCKGAELHSLRCTVVISPTAPLGGEYRGRGVWSLCSHPSSCDFWATAFRISTVLPDGGRGGLCRGCQAKLCLGTGPANCKVHFFTLKRNRLLYYH